MKSNFKSIYLAIALLPAMAMTSLTTSAATTQEAIKKQNMDVPATVATKVDVTVKDLPAPAKDVNKIVHKERVKAKAEMKERMQVHRAQMREACANLSQGQKVVVKMGDKTVNGHCELTFVADQNAN